MEEQIWWNFSHHSDDRTGEQENEITAIIWQTAYAHLLIDDKICALEKLENGGRQRQNV